ncbi:restriction endonuclease subunit S domain-containing protein [Mameliella alba]|uniref:Restriction modification system DNA specificity domain protein n=1 Tax=Mameliella alba TaxID=561184 RepID=A0A0B3RL89_9RHOB|nr:restriction endonuclease subunit S [Mameliella alba]KHQ51990.1 Restriction modification system DNA specificity domain protein [Mameliella alba]
MRFEEQRRLIALLKEKRQAVISHAVTKGLDPAAPMKPSGIDWLGDIPAHWEAVQVRRVFAGFEQGWSPDCHAKPAAYGEWGVLKTGCVNGGIFRDTENKTLPEETEPCVRLEVMPGDLVMSRASGSPQLIGSMALVQNTQPKLMLSDKLFRILLQDAQEPAFIAWLFGSNPIREQIVLAISGAEGMANNLPQSKIKEILVPLVPQDEQQQIAAYLDAQTRRMDTLTAEAERAITLLQERRSALISAAVTGKIDVRDTIPNSTEAA